jgi:hypothetical protein
MPPDDKGQARVAIWVAVHDGPAEFIGVGSRYLTCSDSLFRPAIMAWRGTNPLRCLDAQDDHSAQLLLTHSDHTVSSTGAIPVRPTELVPPKSSRHCDRAGRRYLPTIHATTSA